MPRLISVLIVICLLFTSACSRVQEQQEQQEQKEKAGIQSIDFTLPSLEGEEIVLSEILEKKKVLLVFWATWCPYCLSELPRVEEFYRQNQDRVMAIAVDIGESKTQVEKVVQRIDLSYPVVLDYEGRVARQYRVLGVPTVVAIDQQGKIIYYGHAVQELLMTVEF